MIEQDLIPLEFTLPPLFYHSTFIALLSTSATYIRTILQPSTNVLYICERYRCPSQSLGAPSADPQTPQAHVETVHDTAFHQAMSLGSAAPNRRFRVREGILGRRLLSRYILCVKYRKRCPSTITRETNVNTTLSCASHQRKRCCLATNMRSGRGCPGTGVRSDARGKTGGEAGDREGGDNSDEFSV